MKWWGWWRRPRRPLEGATARREAEDRLRQACERWPEVREVAEALREHQRRNGFGEAMLMLFRGGSS